MAASEVAVLGGLGLLAYALTRKPAEKEATSDKAPPAPLATHGDWAVLPDGTVVNPPPDVVKLLFPDPVTPGPPGPPQPPVGPPQAPRGTPGWGLGWPGLNQYREPDLGVAKSLVDVGGFLNAGRPGIVPPKTAPPGGVGPRFGSAVRTGGYLQGIFSVVQGAVDVAAQKQGQGPYAQLSRPATIVAATANTAAGTAVGAGSLGLASLDLNRGVHFLGLPVATPGTKPGSTSILGGLFTIPKFF